jgi:hypothetical protein
MSLDGPRLVLGMKIDYKSSFASPEVGPFMSVLLHKLDDMLNNTLFVNLQLTGIFARLAAHPQPLLSSFLLNSDLVFQPSIRSLFQVCPAFFIRRLTCYVCRSSNRLAPRSTRTRRTSTASTYCCSAASSCSIRVRSATQRPSTEALDPLPQRLVAHPFHLRSRSNPTVRIARRFGICVYYA